MRLLPPALRGSVIPSVAHAGLGLVAPLAEFVPDPVIGAATAGAEELLGRLAALTDAIPDRHLALLMRTPARRLVVEAIFLVLPRYLERTSLAGLELAIRWRVAERGSLEPPDIYDLIIAGRRCRVTRDEPQLRPLLTITVEPLELLRLATGRSDLMRAYLGGRLSLRGDIVQAVRLGTLLAAAHG